MDRLSPKARSRNMARIKDRNTEPELRVRKFLYGAGLRFRLHRKDLPGKPDIVFANRHTCVFVHGCFWHGCPHCIDGVRRVKSNSAYWSNKIAGNRRRDARHVAALEAAGWKVFVVWECGISESGQLSRLAESIKSVPRRSH